MLPRPRTSHETRCKGWINWENIDPLQILQVPVDPEAICVLLVATSTTLTNEVFQIKQVVSTAPHVAEIRLPIPASSALPALILANFVLAAVDLLPRS